ncbi:MMPL family transporter [Mycobacterium sp. 852002-40037_SCH5390672]|uniref:MMPL family transporter n=1 Tax=Mycobacterium sp. 852002-40037_SCH5390672 TaxID=1834089 RepID=UPI0009EE3900|nr:MMPL family transporter [Mycobacterium sp. 852002-40037_SCH5390672]
MLHRIAMTALAAPRRVIAAGALLFIAAAAFGIPVAQHLSAGGFHDPGSESAQATRLLTDKFGQSDQQIVISVSAPDGARSPHARDAANEIISHLQRSPFVLNVASAWTSPPPTNTGLISKNGKSGLIVANLTGDQTQLQAYAKSFANQIGRDRDSVTVRTGGTAALYAQVNEQSERDLFAMEMIAVPLSFLALVWAFGGLLAAALPVAVGLMAIVESMAVLRVINLSTQVSIYALNLSTAMGLALAIDYTLLIVSRYRDELNDGAMPDEALIQTMVTAGRAVLFSATTVASSMLALVLFPMYFLKSFAYAGVATVAFAAFAAVTITPAALVLIGPKLDSFDIRQLARQVLRRPPPLKMPLQKRFWYRWSMFVMRHAVPLTLIVTALLVSIGLPFLGLRWGFSDDRMLPRSASARQVGDQLRHDFTDDLATVVFVVIPDTRGLSPADLERYAADLSRVPDVSSVTAPAGSFVGGNMAGPPSTATGMVDGSALLTITSTAPLNSRASDLQLDRLHGVRGPAGRSVLLGGLAQTNRDSVDAIAAKLPVVLGLVALIAVVLVLLLTGSAVLPLKALILNVLSLTATFGALVWIFQDGHLGGLGTTPTGTLIANTPVLLFCIAFGLSMDYEIFLISRIRELWLTSQRTSSANQESIARGIALTGRVVTAAALVMSISFAALTASQVSFMRMLGLGLTLAVLADATLVRMVLVPASMHLLGRANWWAPKPLSWLHDKVALSASDRMGKHRAPAESH